MDGPDGSTGAADRAQVHGKHTEANGQSLLRTLGSAARACKHQGGCRMYENGMRGAVSQAVLGRGLPAESASKLSHWACCQ